MSDCRITGRVVADSDRLDGLLRKRRGIGGLTEQTFHRAYGGQSAEVGVTQELEPIVNGLGSADIFLACGDVAQAEGVDFEDGGKEYRNQGCRDGNFYEGKPGLSARVVS